MTDKLKISKAQIRLNALTDKLQPDEKEVLKQLDELLFYRNNLKIIEALQRARKAYILALQ